EKLRRPSVWGEADARLGDGEQVYERAASFSSKLRQLELSANEQRVLTVVDGRASVRGIAERSGLEPREVGRILYRLAEVQLIASAFLAADLGLDAERREHHGNDPHH